MNNIFLIGSMGSGKSVTGRSLAVLLKVPFIDLDEKIEEETGMKIAKIFELQGEAAFRKKEAEVLKKCAPEKNAVIATGGGVILSKDNRLWLNKYGTVIYLETGLESLWPRVRENKDRPLLKGDQPKRALEVLLEQRKPLYQNACHMTVQTDGKTAGQVAGEIAEMLKAL